MDTWGGGTTPEYLTSKGTNNMSIGYDGRK
jgi:hypothetical protein